MIGPQAYERYTQTKFHRKGEHEAMKEYTVKHRGMRYIYCYDWEILSMFGNTITDFKNWCFADTIDNGGEYADSVEVVE